MKLLLAEDEIGMSEALTDILTYHKYLVDAVYNGADALAYARAEKYDGIILDIMMPQIDGLEVLKTLRKEGYQTPVLLLTAKSEVEDRILGLDAGADDYLPKPFAMGELLARVRAMLRRREVYTPEVLTCGGVSLDLRSCELSGGGKSFSLSRMEFLLIELLMLNQGIYLSADKILEKVWGHDSNAEQGNVWVYISYLRKKLAELDCGVGIRAKRNIGYMLEVSS